MEQMVRVVDIPIDSTPEQAELLLNAPYKDDFYLGWIAFDLWGVGARAFFKRRVSEKSHGKSKSDPDGKDAEARAIVQANARLTISGIVTELRAHGIKRSTGWVSNMRAERVQQSTCGKARLDVLTCATSLIESKG
jgi:hypothetical protein